MGLAGIVMSLGRRGEEGEEGGGALTLLIVITRDTTHIQHIDTVSTSGGNFTFFPPSLDSGQQNFPS